MFSEKTLTRCPECHKSTVRRIPQLPAVIFKGTGWYSIDHRSASNQKISPDMKKDDKAGSTTSGENKR
jgi:predicted nucleic acid-binding Zn ribbon protein